MAARGASNVGGQNPEFIWREFAGLNVLDGREAINDNEFAWCENAIPIASAKLLPVNGPSSALATVSTETGSPSYVKNFNVAGTDYCFAVWAATGNGYVVNLSTFAITAMITGLTSGKTSATQYSNQGLLIIDPTGYWDWSVTTPNTLTPQNGSLAFATLQPGPLTLAMGTSLQQHYVPASGTGGSYQTDYEVTNVTINAAGTGYAVGDTINLTDGNPITSAQIVVASVGVAGAITGITLTAGGEYPGPTSGTFVQVGPTGNVTSTTGAGTGATFTGHMVAYQATILTRGTGYPALSIGLDRYQVGALFFTVAAVNVTSSGVIGGTAIAVYAGRVWIAFGRTVYFTDINSYNSFGGVGGSFFIPESYLHNNVTALFAANNYLYIFGDTSIDALSNVTVAAGITSFSRINVTASVGTSTPTSVFAYYRAICFYHASGFYLLAGATPEKISDKISGLIQNLAVASQGTDIPAAYGCEVQVAGELCATFLFNLNDVFTQGGASRTIFALFFRNRWWTATLGSASNLYFLTQAMISVPVLVGVATIYAWATNSLYRAFNPASALASWLIKSKLWDAGAPTHDKQSINAAIAGTWSGTNVGVTLNVDTEINTEPAVISPLTSVTAGYHFNASAANNGGTQYLGLTATGSTDMTQINMLALRGKSGDRDKLQ